MSDGDIGPCNTAGTVVTRTVRDVEETPQSNPSNNAEGYFIDGRRFQCNQQDHIWGMNGEQWSRILSDASEDIQ